MDKFGSAYKQWVGHLIRKKLYTMWMYDLKCLANKDSYEAIEIEKQHFKLTDISENFVINTNEKHTNVLKILKCESILELRELLTDITQRKVYYIWGTSINWCNEYDEFVNPQFVLSRKLSKKISIPTRVKLIKKYKERQKEEQPWYSKSYEKRFKHIWRR